MISNSETPNNSTSEQQNMSFKRLYTLIFIRRENQILLGYKTRGLGVGLWNGFGGKLHKNETIPDCAARELKEESNLEADLKHVGVVTYFEEDKPTEEVVHVFTSYKFQGNIVESEEMSPIKWFDVKSMPYEKMWPDAPKWIPFMLSGQFFKVDVTYGGENYGFVKKVEKNLFQEKHRFQEYINVC